MERRQLEHFLAVIESGGMSAAAARVGISQPSLSQSIAALERGLGVQLFRRSSHGVEPTLHGEALIAPAYEVVRGFRGVRAAMEAAPHRVTGHIDVVCPPLFARHPVAAVMGRFRQERPGVTFRVRKPTARMTVRQALTRGIAEVGFTPDSHPNSSLTERLLCEDELWALRPPGSTPVDEISLETLLREPLIMPAPGSLARSLLEEHVGPQSLARAVIAIETEHPGSVVPLVAAGLGSALVPRAHAMAGTAAGAFSVPVHPTIARQIHVVCHPDCAGVTRTFVDFVLDSTPDLLESL